MISRTLVLFLSYVFFLSIPAFALDQASENALNDTKAKLVDPSQRNKMLEENNQTRTLKKSVGDLANSPENEQKMYELSALLLERLVRESNGDQAKLSQIMQEAQSNPEKFASKFSAAELKALRDIAGAISDKSSPGPKP